MKKSDFLLRFEDYIIKDMEGDDLTTAQLYVLWSVMNFLTSSRSTTLIARGESDENLRKHYFADTEQLPLLLNTIFNIGEKGRLCLGNDDWIDPDDISIKNFEKITKLLQSVLNTAYKGSTGRIKSMTDFISKNRDFANDFISGGRNLNKKYERLESENKRLINMYYLSIVHTINSNEYKYQSIYLSASQDIEVAEHFKRSLLIIGWMPKHSFQPYVASKNTNVFITICKTVGLPFAKTPVYPEQAEISVRYGLLPHFIIGVEIRNTFYVNPSLFETMELFASCDSIKQMAQLRMDIMMHGFKVNQENFLEYCRNTKYRRYFSFDGIQYRLNNLE